MTVTTRSHSNCASREAFELEAADLPFDVDSIDAFNSRIQLAIESAERSPKEKRAEALALAQVKFLANQKFNRLFRVQS